jgi:hypothetical protein
MDVFISWCAQTLNTFMPGGLPCSQFDEAGPDRLAPGRVQNHVNQLLALSCMLKLALLFNALQF